MWNCWIWLSIFFWNWWIGLTAIFLNCIIRLSNIFWNCYIRLSAIFRNWIIRQVIRYIIVVGNSLIIRKRIWLLLTLTRIILIRLPIHIINSLKSNLTSLTNFIIILLIWRKYNKNIHICRNKIFGSKIHSIDKCIIIKPFGRNEISKLFIRLHNNKHIFIKSILFNLN